MTTKYDEEEYRRLVEAQRAQFPSMTLPPEYAELFEINTLQILIKLARYKFAARMVKKSDAVLEVGSGTGLGALFLSQFAASVTGLEIKPHDYEDAVSVNRRENVSFRLESLFDHAPEKKYNAIVSLDVIEHLPPEDGEQFVKKFGQLCDPNGFVLIGTPSIYSYPYQGKYSQAAHVKCYDQQELVDLVEKYFSRTFVFSMNDEIVHTGHPKMAWYYFVLGVQPR